MVRRADGEARVSDNGRDAAAWIAVDWGTSRLRAWGLSVENDVLWREAADIGSRRLRHDDFEPALLSFLAARLGPGRTLVLVAGTAGAREGWSESPYRRLPCPPLGPPGQLGAVPAPTRDARLDVHILPGLAQAEPPDVMRGEEVQIAGFLSLNPGFDGVICLPGSHSKWALISAGEVVGCAGALTGELYAALCDHTVLRHVTATGEGTAAWDGPAFKDGLGEGMASPDKLLARLFALRAEGVLGLRAPGEARAWLSGLLIGAELAALRGYWLGQNLAVLGAAPLAGRYTAALTAQGAAPIEADGEAMALRGLIAAHARLAPH
jgi:2-dehydro-3-deoxygalactonokinase